MSSDPDYGDQCKVAAALNAAALRREKAAALASGPRAAPEPLQKRKKEKVDKDVIQVEKVTPDAKLSRAETSSSMGSASDESVVQNLIGKLEAAESESLDVPMAPIDVPVPSPEEPDSHPRTINQWIPGSWEKMVGEEIVDSPSPGRMSSLPTVPFSPHAAEHLAAAISAAGSSRDKPAEPGTTTALNEAKEKVDDTTVVPVATPTRAMIAYWSKFKVPQSKHMSPGEAASPEAPATGTSAQVSPPSATSAGGSNDAVNAVATPTPNVVPVTAPTPDATMTQPVVSPDAPQGSGLVPVAATPVTASMTPPSVVSPDAAALTMAPPSVGSQDAPQGSVDVVVPATSTPPLQPVVNPGDAPATVNQEGETGGAGLISAALARATTVDLMSSGPPLPTPVAPAGTPAAPPPAPSSLPQEEDEETVKFKRRRAAKGRFHRSVRSSRCPAIIKEKIKEAQASKDQYEFDKLYDQFVQCGEDWLKSDLVISTTSTREHARTGSWKTMSKADLMAKYNDATLVDDLVARKTEAGLWVSNPDFPNNQDLREYWCWSMMEEKDTNLRANSISTTSTGHLDQATAKALMHEPLTAGQPEGHLKVAAEPKSGAPEPKPKPKPKSAPKVPKAKTAGQEATKAMKDAATCILECKSWKTRLTDAGAPQHMIDALVNDCNKYLATLESDRQVLEGSVASGKEDEQIRLETQKLCQSVLSYKEAAKHCKKHAVKPKAKAKAPSGAAAEAAS